MGADIDEAALTACIRNALYAHLDEYVEGDDCPVTVFEGDGNTIELDAGGYHFTLTLQPAGAVVREPR